MPSLQPCWGLALLQTVALVFSVSQFVFHMFGIILLSSGNSSPGGRYWFQSRTGKTSSCIWGREPFRAQSFFFLKCIREINTLPITCYIFTFRAAGFSLPNLCEGMCIFFLHPFCSMVKYSPPGLLKEHQKGDFASQWSIMDILILNSLAKLMWKVC